MFKKLALSLTSVFICVSAFAQQTDSVYNKYVDFNLARFQGEKDKVMELGEELIPLANQLPEKTRVNFYFSAGKMYEDASRPIKAVYFYEKVATAVPDYYVVHRALGYLYLEKVKAIEKQLMSPQYDEPTKAQLAVAYHEMIKKTIPHLEKAQACDPSDETLGIIKMLLDRLNDTQGLSTLDARLKELSKSCIDILSDQ